MSEFLVPQERATQLVYWPTGKTYACTHHAESLRKIASSMGIHIAIDALRANCEAETGLPAPIQPVWTALREAAE